MDAREKQVIESYQRVQTFLATHPAPAPANYGEPKVILDAVVSRLTGHTSEQAAGTRLSQAERRRQVVLLSQLRERHLRPIVAIARATMKEQPGIEAALRMPDASLGVLKLVAQASAIADAVAQYEPSFVKNGRPADFVAQLKAAIEAVKESTIGRAKNVGRQVGATAGIGQELRRGRRAVEMLDSIVKVVFEENDQVLREWEVARRVKGLPGGGPAVVAAPTLEPKAA